MAYFPTIQMSQRRKRQKVRGRDKPCGLTQDDKRQNVIDSYWRDYYRIGQRFRQEMRPFDKKMLEKTENDRQIAKKWYRIRLEMTTMSMWITLWKLGISQMILDHFKKIGVQKWWKSRCTVFGLEKGKPIGSIGGGGEKQNLFDAEWQIVVY